MCVDILVQCVWFYQVASSLRLRVAENPSSEMLSITSLSNCCSTEHYSYSRIIRKQAIWPSDKKDVAEGEVTHSQDSREPDGATMS